MSSIHFNGYDFSDITTCAVDEGAHPIATTEKVVPGRAGSLLLATRVPPRVLKVRLFLDPRYKPEAGGLSDLRHDIYNRLAADGGATLRLPTDPALEWHDVVCTGAGDWTTLEENASCELEFTCFDPVAYGMKRAIAASGFEVEGTWPTWPTFELTASPGSALQIGNGTDVIRIEHGFGGGETVLIDCERETVTIDGADGRASVALATDFFALAPGECTLVYAGCSNHVLTYRERWL